VENIIKFGILGCGMISDIHAKAIKSIENARLVIAFDNNSENAMRFAQRHGIKAAGTFEELADAVDAVCICTPSGFHSENAKRALLCKKHVVLEKPMAFTCREADRIIEACEMSGRLLTVISQLRFSEDVKRVKELVDQNAFGRLIFCDLYMKYYRNEEYYGNSSWRGTLKYDGGGALMNQGIHGVDLLQYIMGEPNVLKGKVATLSHDIEAEDTAAALLEFSNGAMGVIEASTCAYPGFERRLEIMGDRGYVILQENSIVQLMLNGEKSVIGNKASGAGGAGDPSAISHELHKKQIQNFVNAINGTEPLMIDAREGKKAIKIIESIYKYRLSR